MKSVAWALQISSRWGGGRPRVMRMRGKQPLVSLGFCTSSSNPITHWTNNCALKLIYQILPFSEAIQCTLHQIPLRIGQIFALWNWSIKSVHFLMQFSVHFIPCVVEIWVMDPCIDSPIGYIYIYTHTHTYCSIALATLVSPISVGYHLEMHTARSL